MGEQGNSHNDISAIPVPRPEDLTAMELAYYRETWGFDPIKDQVKTSELGVSLYYYETCLPLDNDLSLRDAGVQVVARVQLDNNGGSRNRLGFECGRKRSLIECVHTAIYDATPAVLADFSPGNYTQLVRTTEGHPAMLPPWEHFVALKSFAAGLVEQGVMSALFGWPGEISVGDNLEDKTLEVLDRAETRIFDQLVHALAEVAPEIVEPQLMERAGDVLERAPEDWIKSHAEPLQIRYHFHLLLGDREYLASVDDVMLKKLLLLFLGLARSDLSIALTLSGLTFLGHLRNPEFLASLDPDTTRDLIWVVRAVVEHGGEGLSETYLLGLIFRVLFSRRDALLGDPAILETLLTQATDPFDEETFPAFATGPDDAFLARMLDIVFQIWQGDRDAMMGNTPYILMRHFLARSRRDEGLKKFLMLAPVQWLGYYWPRLDTEFQLEATFVDHLNPLAGEEKRLKEILVALSADKKFWQY